MDDVYHLNGFALAGFGGGAQQPSTAQFIYQCDDGSIPLRQSLFGAALAHVAVGFLIKRYVNERKQHCHHLVLVVLAPLLGASIIIHIVVNGFGTVANRIG